MTANRHDTSGITSQQDKEPVSLVKREKQEKRDEREKRIDSRQISFRRTFFGELAISSAIAFT
jgi:hypothetical protein